MALVKKEKFTIPTVFGQIQPKNSPKFTQIGDFLLIVESLDTFAE
jgi:hypothetical protein